MAATTLLQCHASSSSSSSCSCALRPSLNLNKKPFLFPSSKRLFLVNSPLVFSHSLSIHSHRQSHSHGHSYHSFANSPCRASVSQTSETELPLCRKPPSETLVVVAGATGYIGRYVARELVNRGYNVATLARPRSGIGGKNGPEDTLRQMEGTTVCFGEVTDIDSLSSAMSSLNGPVDVVVSCLASRTGGIKDSWRIDYQATLNCLTAGRNAGAKHFVLLSAICVQKPLLEFQKAKLKFEDELKKLADEASITYSIVRPTAFFKSLAGQVETVKNGNPYVMFGDGTLCACKPISEEDLASFIADCIRDEDKINKILPIGGPGKALTPKEQAEMLFEILGKEPKFLKAPVAFMDFVISILDFLKKFFPSLEDAAEFGRIGKYYATESMLVYDPDTDTYDADATPSYGKDTLEEFLKRVVKEGLAGQELGDQAVFRSS